MKLYYLIRIFDERWSTVYISYYESEWEVIVKKKKKKSARECESKYIETITDLFLEVYITMRGFVDTRYLH